MADDLIDVEDDAGNRFRISAAHRNRYPSVAASFRPVKHRKEEATPVAPKTAPAVDNAPTGDKNKEN